MKARSGLERLWSAITSKLGRTAAMFFLTNVVGAVIPIALLPVLTRYLTPADYGILAMFQVLVGVTIPFVGVNGNGAIARQYYRRKEIDFPRYVGNGFLLLLVSLTVVGGIYFLFGPAIERFTGYPVSWMWSVVGLAAANFATLVVGAIWQVEARPIPYGVYFIGLTLLELLFAIYLIVGEGWEWEGRVVSRLAVTVFFAVVAIGILVRKKIFDLRPHRGYLRHLVMFGAPLIPHSLGMWAITMTDRLFLTNMIDVSATGLYVVGVQIAMAVNLLVTGFAAAFTPWFYEKLTEGNEADKRLIVQLTYAMGAVFFATAVAVGLLAPWLLELLVGEEFRGAERFILVLALGNASYGCYRLVVGYLFFEEKTQTIGVITVATAALNVAANYFLITSNGAIGAAQATFIAYSVSFGLVWLASARTYPMPWNLRRK